MVVVIGGMAVLIGLCALVFGDHGLRRGSSGDAAVFGVGGLVAIVCGMVLIMGTTMLD